MIRKPDQKKQDLFQRRNVKDLTVPEHGDYPKRSLKGVNMLHMGMAFLLFGMGVFSIVLALTGQIETMWISSTLSLAGSICVLAAAFFIYETVKGRKNVDNLVRKAIWRAMHDHN